MHLPLLDQIRAANLPDPVEEFRFYPTRKWRFDLAWPERLLAVEVQGGIWSSGRHVRGRGYENDCEKLCEAVLARWRILWIPTPWITSGKALTLIARALEA